MCACFHFILSLILYHKYRLKNLKMTTLLFFSFPFTVIYWSNKRQAMKNLTKKQPFVWDYLGHWFGTVRYISSLMRSSLACLQRWRDGHTQFCLRCHPPHADLLSLPGFYCSFLPKMTGREEAALHLQVEGRTVRDITKR